MSILPKNTRSQSELASGRPKEPGPILRALTHRFTFVIALVVPILFSTWYAHHALTQRAASQAAVLEQTTKLPHESQVLISLLARVRDEGWFEIFFHTATPLAVLFIELVVLVRMKRESVEREQLTYDLQSFKTIMGRDNYLQQIQSSIRQARRKILFTTFSMDPSSKNVGQRAIVDAVKSRLREDRGYEHYGIIAKRPEALPGTFELLFEVSKILGTKKDGQAKFEVRMSHVLSQTRLRFVTRDDEYSLLGLSDGSPELSNLHETNLCFAVNSTMLASALELAFNAVFDNAESPWDYLSELIEESRKSHVKYSQNDVLVELGILHGTIENEFREFLSRQCESFRQLPIDRNYQPDRITAKTEG